MDASTVIRPTTSLSIINRSAEIIPSYYTQEFLEDMLARIILLN